jgi:hypothetical protein
LQRRRTSTARLVGKPQPMGSSVVASTAVRGGDGVGTERGKANRASEGGGRK